MKRFVFAAATFCFALNVATAQVMEIPVVQQTAPVNGPAMTFEKTEMDYGTIAQGSDPLRKFKFKNTGTQPLKIKSAQGSCGCTVPKFKDDDIQPGETGEIEVRYDTNRIGGFTKSVTITTNEATPTRVLMIKGTVNEKKQEDGVPATAPSFLSGH
ncbi:MAG: hypothetical protein RL329_185 [Bacteroidota bacterium]|jgi:hypothetical protein